MTCLADRAASFKTSVQIDHVRRMVGRRLVRVLRGHAATLLLPPRRRAPIARLRRAAMARERFRSARVRPPRQRWCRARCGSCSRCLSARVRVADVTRGGLGRSGEAAELAGRRGWRARPLARRRPTPRSWRRTSSRPAPSTQAGARTKARGGGGPWPGEDRAALRSTRVDAGVPRLDGPGAGRAGPGRRIGDDTRAGTASATVIRDSARHAQSEAMPARATARSRTARRPASDHTRRDPGSASPAREE